MIEILVPHDEQKKKPDGQAIHEIPDWTIKRAWAAGRMPILLKFMYSKGKQYTTVVIPGATRRESDASRTLGEHRVRSVPTSAQIPENLDRALLRESEDVDSFPVAYKSDIHSHVLLAACGQQERAQEATSDAGESCGLFTDSLIKKLREIVPHHVTCAELVELLSPLAEQNPHCEGANKHRFLFEVEGRVPMT
ncbi:hypothetical protein C8R44DRAFT_728219 [Mycena epipterygia]|nr:hypothetical protein C8R44DRAFT_728219 [Mycena epipterygia]